MIIARLRPGFRAAALFVPLFAAAGCGSPEKGPPATSTAAATLDRLLTAAHEQVITASVSTQLKYKRPIDRLPAVSLADAEARAAAAKTLLDTLGTVKRTDLTPKCALARISVDAVRLHDLP